MRRAWRTWQRWNQATLDAGSLFGLTGAVGLILIMAALVIAGSVGGR